MGYQVKKCEESASVQANRKSSPSWSASATAKPRYWPLDCLSIEAPNIRNRSWTTSFEADGSLELECKALMRAIAFLLNGCRERVKCGWPGATVWSPGKVVKSSS